MTDSKEVHENGILINIENTVQTPRKNEIVFNPDMSINRSLALAALATFIESEWCLNKTIRCLDGFGATGVAGLSWTKLFPNIEVTINDSSEASVTAITKNKELNNLNVEITQQDVNILLLQRPFDFIYLDCYGSSVYYMDAVFKNVPKNSVVVITSTDDAALYGKASDVTVRNYGGFIMKTFYAKELAARLVIASIIRAAAKCNKGVEVLSAIAVKSHITVIAKVTRGPTAATQCVHKLQKIIHCCLCEDRAFYSHSIHPIENPYTYLSCECRSRSSGQVAVELGPVWTDSIFEPSFCAAMLHSSTKLEQTPKLTSLLQTVLTESLGGTSTDEFKGFTFEKNENKDGDKNETDETPKIKKIKLEDKGPTSLCSPFYFNLHRHSPKGYDLGKLNKVVSFIQASGHLASRTHFDPEAVRTSASLKEFNELLIKFAKGTNQ